MHKLTTLNQMERKYKITKGGIFDMKHIKVLTRKEGPAKAHVGSTIPMKINELMCKLAVGTKEC